MKIGGQAVIEGVMIRNKEKFAVATRLPNGKIKVKKEKNNKFPKFFNIFFIRGIVTLIFTLIDGLKALIWSSNQQLGKDEQITKKEIAITLILSFLFAILIFVVVPFFSARFIVVEGIWFDVLDGVFRVILFLVYLGAISLMKDVKRIFEYHGAEHKTIACYEAKKKLTVKNVRTYCKEHARCGTAFLFLVLIVSIFLFSLISGSLWIKLMGRIILLPVVAGISYEILKLGDKFRNNFFVRMIVAPGLWLQRITTRNPDKKQIEVAIKAVEAVVR